MAPENSYSKPKEYSKPETLISVDTQIGEPTVNHQKRRMQVAGNAGGDRPRMLPEKTKGNPNFV